MRTGRPLTTEEKEILDKSTAPSDCQSGELLCPYFNDISSTFQFCIKKEHRGKDCPINGMISIQTKKSEQQENLPERDWKLTCFNIISLWNSYEQSRSNHVDVCNFARKALINALQGAAKDLGIHIINSE